MFGFLRAAAAAALIALVSVSVVQAGPT